MRAIPEEITARYWNMIPAHIDASCEPEPGTSMAHLRWMLQELRTMEDIGKANRWLGFIQGILISRGWTDVTTERNFTRPFFRK
jgi:hypothetical protein